MNCLQMKCQFQGHFTDRRHVAQSEPDVVRVLQRRHFRRPMLGDVQLHADQHEQEPGRRWNFGSGKQHQN